MIIENLTIGYKKPLAENLCFEISKGELVCLIGSNGSGKSTLLKTIAGLLKPLQGKVIIEESDELAKIIAFVPANFPAETNIRVFDFVALGRTPHTNALGKLKKEDLEIIDISMREAEVADFAKRRVNNLSDGEKQRVALARALAQEPKIILMDEPTAFLDYKHRIKLFDFLRKLCESGKICLISTHELDFAKKYADRILDFDSLF